MSCNWHSTGDDPCSGPVFLRAFRRKSDGWLQRDDRCEGHRSSCNIEWEPAACGLLGHTVTVKAPPWAGDQPAWLCQACVDATTRVPTFRTDAPVADGMLAVVIATREGEDWVHVVLADGRLGWLAGCCLELEPPPW